MKQRIPRVIYNMEFREQAVKRQASNGRWVCSLPRQVNHARYERVYIVTGPL